MRRLRAGPQNPKEEAAVDYHLRTQDPGLLAQVEKALSSTLAGLGGVVTVYIDATANPRLEDGTKRALGYVRGFPGWWTTDIHVTPYFFDEPQTGQGWAMLHEATHRWGGTVDHKYYEGHTRPVLTAAQAAENADSLAAFCLGFLEGDAAEKARRWREQLAEQHRAELFVLWEKGDIELYTHSWVSPEGETIEASIVAAAVYHHFRAERTADHTEVLAAMETQEEGPFTCSSGLVVRKDLYEYVYYEDGPGSEGR